MCDSPELLKALERIEKLLASDDERPVDQDYNISATLGFFLDYKGRKHLYLFSPTAFTLLLPDIGGSLSITANTWTDISYRPGLQIFASSAQTSALLVKVRATNVTIAGASSGGGGGAVTAAAGSYAAGFSTDITAIKNSVANIPAQGQAAMAASLPVAIANNQGAVPVGPSAGTAFDTNEGTAGANTLRTIAGAAATGTQTSVASSASDGTILASNTSRKGAIIYNDSTQTLFLLLASGTSSSSNYSVQIPSNGFFELPGPAIYSGVIKGIWAAANGNARVTEFT